MRLSPMVENALADTPGDDFMPVPTIDTFAMSIVGTGMKSSPGVSAKAFSTMGDNRINILAISTSPIRLSMVVDAAQATQAVQCLHTAFGLDSDSVFEETQLSAEEIAAKMQKGR